MQVPLRVLCSRARDPYRGSGVGGRGSGVGGRGSGVGGRGSGVGGRGSGGRGSGVAGLGVAGLGVGVGGRDAGQQGRVLVRMNYVSPPAGTSTVGPNTGLPTLLPVHHKRRRCIPYLPNLPIRSDLACRAAVLQYRSTSIYPAVRGRLRVLRGHTDRQTDR